MAIYDRYGTQVFWRLRDITTFPKVEIVHHPSCKMTPRCFIIMGRAGDIIQCLPMFQASGHPVVITSKEYGSALEGVSYVECIEIDCDWSKGMSEAKRKAAQFNLEPVVLQFWADEPFLWDRSYLANFKLGPDSLSDYGTAMWRAAGFDAHDMKTLPVVFDRRDLERERQLVEMYKARGKQKPMLLVNFTGKSSPFPAMPECYQEIMKWAHKFNIVHLDALQCHRIYDLLGLYDLAAGLITIDTATLHLAAASKVPYIAFTNNGFAGSVPKGNCVKEIKYNQAGMRLNELAPILEVWSK